MRSNWLLSTRKDLLLLFGPVWFTWLICFSLPARYLTLDVSLWVWVVVVLCIDVGHVWSTLYRTYFSKEEFANHRSTLLIVPPLAFISLFALAFVSVSWFWTILAYVAVYHFVKQQYGFMKIFKARARDFGKKIFNDTFIIYLAMGYPILFWHVNHDRNFSWFVEGDFFAMPAPELFLTLFNTLGTAIYVILVSGWLIEELSFSIKSNQVPAMGKLLWILTTAGNWFLGIVYFNSDLVFTLTNVVAHGVPYFVLIFLYIDRKETRTKKIIRPIWFKTSLFAGMIALVLLIALTEEYLWDMWLYRDNAEFFQQIFVYPFNVAESRIAIAIALAVLSLPQVTHYILDGFIWKVNEKNPYLKETIIKV